MGKSEDFAPVNEEKSLVCEENYESFLKWKQQQQQPLKVIFQTQTNRDAMLKGKFLM